MDNSLGLPKEEGEYSHFFSYYVGSALEYAGYPNIITQKGFEI